MPAYYRSRGRTAAVVAALVAVSVAVANDKRPPPLKAMGQPPQTQITPPAQPAAALRAQTLMTTLPRAWPSITYRIATSMSLSGYVRSIVGAIFAVSRSSRRTSKSFAFSDLSDFVEQGPRDEHQEGYLKCPIPVVQCASSFSFTTNSGSRL